MSKVEDMLDSILNKDSGYQMRTEKNVTENERLVYEKVDELSLEQLTTLEKKITMRKERLQYLREQEKSKQNNW